MMTLIHRIAGRIFQNIIYLKILEVFSVRSLVWALQMALVRLPTVCTVPSVNEHKYLAITCVRKSSVKDF